MIQFVEMECPNCGGSLTKTDETTAKCSHCGAEFLIDKGQPERVTNIYQAPEQSRHTLVSILSGVAFFALVIVIAVYWHSAPHTAQKNTAAYPQMEQPETFSEFFLYFTEEVFDMPPEQVTAEQLAKITYLHISHRNSGITVEYSMENEDVQSMDVPSEAASYYEDLGKFTGLHTLDLPNLALAERNLTELTELTEIRTCNSPDELAEIVPHPEKIVILGSYTASSLDGIDTFSNLEQLSIKCTDDLSDLGSLSALKQLKSLTIEKGDPITDFGMLQALTSLEELSIGCEGLKDISFLQYLTSLKKLTITDSILLDISPIGSLTALTELCLEDNDEVTDYSVLSNLTYLETLTLDLNSGTSMPSVDNWSSLTSLSIHSAESIGFLSSLPKLRSLYLSGCDCSDYMALASLQNLEHLKLGSIYGDIPDLTVLNSLSNLKSLDISSLELYGNVEYIFGIPCLEELNISDCSFGLDFAAMPENTSLKRLDMNRIELWKNIYVEYSGPVTNLSYDDVNLADEISFVGKFPNLEELYLQSNKLTEVEFTEALPNLKKLDITDNYVTDLRPLSNLQQLETVWCGGNSISHGLDLGERVEVVSDSEGEERW